MSQQVLYDTVCSSKFLTTIFDKPNNVFKKKTKMKVNEKWNKRDQSINHHHCATVTLKKLSKEEFLASYHHDEINSSNICHMKKRTFKRNRTAAKCPNFFFFLLELNGVPDVIRQMSSFFGSNKAQLS